jgi:hypothetical protein
MTSIVKPSNADRKWAITNSKLLLGLLLFVNACSALRALRIYPSGVNKFLLRLGTVDALLEDGLGIMLLELGLEVLQACLIAAAVGTATGVGQVEAGICYFFAFNAPTLTVSFMEPISRVVTEGILYTNCLYLRHSSSSSLDRHR